MQPLGLSHVAPASPQAAGAVQRVPRQIPSSFSSLALERSRKKSLNFRERDPALPECFGCPYRASIVPEDLQKQICGVFGRDTIWGDMPGEFINHRLDRVVAVFVHSCVAPLPPLALPQR